MSTDRVRTWVAAVVMMDVAAVYSVCLLMNGVYPPSHPWSGITLMLLAVGVVPGVFGGEPARRGSTVSWLHVGGLLFSAGAWTVAAILSR